MTMTPLVPGNAPARYGAPAAGAPVSPEGGLDFGSLLMAALPGAGQVPLAGPLVDPLAGPLAGPLVEGHDSGDGADLDQDLDQDLNQDLGDASALLPGSPGLLVDAGLRVEPGLLTALGLAANPAADPVGASSAPAADPDPTGPAIGPAIGSASNLGTLGDATGTTDTTDTTGGSESPAPAPAAPGAGPSSSGQSITGQSSSGQSITGQSIAGLTAVQPASQLRADLVPGTPPPAPAVADQLFPEVSRLVSRGDGTHRLTMTLTPEALGDVRVVLVVRNGEVSVTFAAGNEAQRALMESAPELRRLLELTGVTESRIQLRDSSSATLPTTPTTGQGSPSGQSETGQHSPDARREPQDQHAGTREGQFATDGNHRGTGATRQPHDPVTDNRPAGVDVTV